MLKNSAKLPARASIILQIYSQLNISSGSEKLGLSIPFQSLKPLDSGI